MTARKPPGLDYETWIDRQIREAEERGEFEDLPGAGEPLGDLGRPYDPNWWAKRKLRSEGLSYTPPSLALRKEAEDAVEAAVDARTEAEARAIVENVNGLIREANRTGIAGPPVMLVPIDVERVVREWRARHAG